MMIAHHPVRPLAGRRRPLGRSGSTGERRVLHRGRWRWLRALSWLVLVFFLTAAGFGLPLRAAVDQFPPGNPALGLAGILLTDAAALGCYLLAVRLGERRWHPSWRPGRRCRD